MLIKQPTISLRLCKSFFSVTFAILGLLLLSVSAFSSPRYALWVEAEGQNQPFLDRSNFTEYLDYVEQGQFTDLFCQVYRGGRSWYPSLMADETPYRNSLARGVDPLKETIKFAHERGIRVHAWVNVLRVTRNFQTPLLKVVGREAALIDSNGESILDYDDEGRPSGRLKNGFILGTPGIWLDPANERLRRYIVETIRDVVIAYPELDGIHLDMIRYPMTLRSGSSHSAYQRPDFGYSEDSIVKFFEFAGKPKPQVTNQLRSGLHASEAWAAWRRAQATLLVFEIREMLNTMAPEMELSAAVIGSRERAYRELFQDWSEWLRGGVVNTVVPMSYSKSTSSVVSQTKEAVSVPGRGQVIAGLGAWLMLHNPRGLAEQGREALRVGADGVALFSYSNLASPRGRNVTSYFGAEIATEKLSSARKLGVKAYGKGEKHH